MSRSCISGSDTKTMDMETTDTIPTMMELRISVITLVMRLLYSQLFIRRFRLRPRPPLRSIWCGTMRMTTGSRLTPCGDGKLHIPELYLTLPNAPMGRLAGRAQAGWTSSREILRRFAILNNMNPEKRILRHCTASQDTLIGQRGLMSGELAGNHTLHQVRMTTTTLISIRPVELA